MYDKTKLTEILDNVSRLPSGKWDYTHYAIDQGNFIYRLWDEANNVVAEITFSRESDRDYAYALLDLITASPALARQCGDLMEKVERLERVAEAAKELVYDAQLIERSIAGRDSYHLYAEDIDVLKQALAALEAGVE